jgi:Spy/CpxP family protein refolding chaperone
MDIARFLGQTALLSVVAFASVVSSAEAPIRSVPRAVELQPAKRGLNNPALKLTDSQRSRIQMIVESYRAEENAKVLLYSSQGLKPDAETALASRQARERMMAAVEQVLDASQRSILKNEQAEQSAKLAETIKSAHPTPAMSPVPAKTDPLRSR